MTVGGGATGKTTGVAAGDRRPLGWLLALVLVAAFAALMLIGRQRAQSLRSTWPP